MMMNFSFSPAFSNYSSNQTHKKSQKSKMSLKIPFLLLLLFGCVSFAQNLTCSSSDGNSTEICNAKTEACCDNECVRLDQACPGFADDEIWVWVVFVLVSLTDQGRR